MTWPSLLSDTARQWLAEIRARAPMCESLRPLMRKPTSTGTISEAACICLRAVVERVRPKVCVEIGTFIGTSALVLASTGARVFTCDKDNDAFKSVGQITAYGKTTSTKMLADIVSKQWSGVHDVTVDLWFFDGRIQDDDLPVIEDSSSNGAVFAFDDYEGREKGVVNVNKLRSYLPGYALIEPAGNVPGAEGRSTIALLVPEGWS